MFWIAAVLVIVFLLVMALFPQLSSSNGPARSLRSLCSLQLGPRAAALVRLRLQGCDVYARTIYGARASLSSACSRRCRPRWPWRSSGWSRRLLRRLGRRAPVPDHRRLLRHPVPARRAIVLSAPSTSPAPSGGRRASCWHPRLGDRCARVMRARSSPSRPSTRTTCPPPGRWAPATAGSCCGTSCPTRSPRCIVCSTHLARLFIAAEATLSFLGVGLKTADLLLGHR